MALDSSSQRMDALADQIKDSLEQDLQQPAARQEHDVAYINVMQSLVEEKVDKYMGLSGMCTCPRCRIDVMALTLSQLPSKYVVVERQDSVPMLSVYDGRYNAAVLSKIMWACERVREHPRHDVSGEERHGVAFCRE